MNSTMSVAAFLTLRAIIPEFWESLACPITELLFLPWPVCSPGPCGLGVAFPQRAL